MDTSSFKEHAKEIESFWQLLTGEKPPIAEALDLCEDVEKAIRRLDGLRMSAVLRNASPQVKRVTWRHELGKLLRDMQPDMPGDADPIDWEIERTDALTYELPDRLPYLNQAHFGDLVEGLGTLLGAISGLGLGRHNAILRLMGEVRASKDMAVIGQFCSDEIVDHYRFLCTDCSHVGRRDVRKFIMIYLELCGIYEKDVSLMRCLLELSKNQDSRYRDVRALGFDGNLGYVRRWGNAFSRPYDDVVRNAAAHIDFVVMDEAVTFNFAKGDGQKILPHSDVVRMTREMSAVVSTFRLLPLILAGTDWKSAKSVLTDSAKAEDAAMRIFRTPI